MKTTFICVPHSQWMHRQLWKTSFAFDHMHSSQYILKINMCLTLNTVTLTDSECEVYVSLSEGKWICWHEWDILEKNKQTEG